MVVVDIEGIASGVEYGASAVVTKCFKRVDRRCTVGGRAQALKFARVFAETPRLCDLSRRPCSGE